ncbi:IS110 family transposase [Actinomycetospora sp. CA-101289]|uniref:IS110 family transposase n=1 Tax=Actinomycetospora sp. CA-101289 TaxID=3239893 RepID=UPI003D979007
MLADLVDVVIGVDTHKHTHTAAVVLASTGAVLAETTVAADPDGYRELVELADAHGGLRAWALEGSASYGAGLANELGARGELVVELDRPARPPRRGGAKSDPIDAVRAARDALARARLAAPRGGAERNALQILLAARRAAVAASTEAQNQLHALVVTAPDRVRARFRGQGTRTMLATALRLRPAHTASQVEVFTALSTLKAIAGRVRALEQEAAQHERAIRAVVTSWRPDLLELNRPGVSGELWD